jgi:acetolactate synthase-1/2/3 large subunit
MKMTGGRAIVESLIAHGVDRVFGLPGAQMYPLFDALHLRRDVIRTFGARHEQTCAYMAFGHARSTGRPGVFSVVPGPGVLNATAALCTAAGCNAPVLCLTGQTPSAFLGKGRGHLHELSDQLGTLRTLVKWAERIEHPRDAPELVAEAFRQMTNGRPGPVALEMCWDRMAESEEVVLRPAASPMPAEEPAAGEIAAAVALLKKARRPMIMVGGGAQHASAEILALAEQIGAPVAAFRGGRGVVSEHHPLGVSSYASFLLWPQTDALIAIGTRAEMPYMRWAGMMQLVDAPEAPPHLIRIDIDPTEHQRLKAHAPILADSAAGARALLAAAQGFEADSTWADEIARAKRQARREIESVQPQIAYLDVIRQELGAEGILTTELSQVGFASYFGYAVTQPRTYISEGFQGTLGFGFPTALGVKAAHPDRPVVCVTGDGGFLFCGQELATAAQEKIGLVTLLFNNNAYGNVLRDQQVGFDNHVIGARLDNPDFSLFARAFGVDYARADSPQSMQSLLRRALDANRPALIEIAVPQGSETNPWPFIHCKR